MKSPDFSEISAQLQAAEIKRRQFLKLGALGTLSGLLASCQAGAITASGSTPTSLPTSTATTPAVLSDAAWLALAKSLRGSLVRANDTQYATARQLFSPRFDNVQPAGVVYCAAPEDVQKCLAFVRKFNLPFAVRCGGHSYEGYSTSTGMIIDVTRMNAVQVDSGAETTTIGGGARLIDIYSELAKQNMALPAGSCPTVGIGGLALGGGAGVLDRKFGLTCDNLLSAQVVLADGRILTCDANHEPELFWALRGGGGGNFGVVTSFTFRIHPVNNLTLFTLSWPWANAAAVLDAWQNWAPQAPDEIWSNCLLDSPANKQAGPIVHVNGVYIGAASALDPLLQQLTGKINTAPLNRYVSGASLLEAMLYEAGCAGKSIGECHLPTQNPAGQVQRDTSSVKSDYFTKLLPPAGIEALINAINTRHNDANLAEGGIGIDACGGAINRVAAKDTAFAHRNALFSAQYSGSWNASDSGAADANHSWLNNTWQALRPHASGQSYQNYVDPDLKDWQQAYYGENLARLQRVKSMYDPNNLFHFAQSIPTVGIVE